MAPDIPLINPAVAHPSIGLLVRGRSTGGHGEIR
jgi:hypothetical protein